MIFETSWLKKRIIDGHNIEFSQWFPGDKNYGSRSVLHDDHLSESELTFLYKSLVPQNIPEHLDYLSSSAYDTNLDHWVSIEPSRKHLVQRWIPVEKIAYGTVGMIPQINQGLIGSLTLWMWNEHKNQYIVIL